MNVPDYPGMAGPASACASPIFPSGRQTGKAPRCRTFPHRSCKRGLIWGVEVLVQKVFHLPSPCAIFYQLRLIALFVNVMNLYNNGLIMTMIMLIMMSLIIAGIASGKTFFVKYFQSHFLQCLQCHFQLQCIQRHFLWCAKLFEVFPLYHQKSLPTPCKLLSPTFLTSQN